LIYKLPEISNIYKIFPFPISFIIHLHFSSIATVAHLLNSTQIFTMSTPSFLPSAIQPNAAAVSTALNDIPLLVDTQAQTNPTTWTIAPTKTGESAIVVTNNAKAMPTADTAAAAIANFINSNNTLSSINFGTASSIDLENQSLLVDSTFAVANGASATATVMSVSSKKFNHSSALTSETTYLNSSVTGANSSGAPADTARVHYSVLAVSGLAILAILC
jgi:hypothetical protein